MNKWFQHAAIPLDRMKPLQQIGIGKEPGVHTIRSQRNEELIRGDQHWIREDTIDIHVKHQLVAILMFEVTWSLIRLTHALLAMVVVKALPKLRGTESSFWYERYYLTVSSFDFKATFKFPLFENCDLVGIFNFLFFVGNEVRATMFDDSCTNDLQFLG